MNIKSAIEAAKIVKLPFLKIIKRVKIYTKSKRTFFRSKAKVSFG